MPFFYQSITSARLGEFGKINRLAVVLVQEEENKIICITKTEDVIGKVEEEKLKEVLESWKIEEKIVACGVDTTSSKNLKSFY